LQVVTSTLVQFNDRSTYVPPNDGIFVDLRFRHYDSDDAAQASAALREAARSGDLKVQIEVEGRSFRGALREPVARGGGLRLKTYGPSAFFALPGAEGLRIVVSDGDRSWEVTADGVAPAAV